MSQLAIFPAKLWDRSSEKETAVRAAAICDTLRLERPSLTEDLGEHGNVPRPRQPGASVDMRIDSHQHFWDPARKDYGWIEALEGEAARRLRRPILPAELAPELGRQRIEGTVLVQAAPSEAEAEFLLSLAEQHTFIAGVVVWLDM